MFHKKEIERWANCPDHTKVWVNEGENEWVLVNYPLWRRAFAYIVDDKYAELRKAEKDGDTILFNGEEQEHLSFNRELRYYSIKKEFTPVLKRSNTSGAIFCFTGKKEGYYIKGGEWKSSKPGDFRSSMLAFDSDNWKDL